MQLFDFFLTNSTVINLEQSGIAENLKYRGCRLKMKFERIQYTNETTFSSLKENFI